MGWLWASQPSSSTSSSSKPPADPAVPTQNAPTNGTGSDFDADPELQKFMAMIQAELGGNTSSSSSSSNSSRIPPQDKSSAAQQPQADSPKPIPPPPAPAQKQQSWFSFASSTKPVQPSTTVTTSQTSDQEPQPQHQQPESDPSSPADGNLSLRDSLLPTTMSCRQAFDEAMHCRSPVGQFNAVYRYGGWQSCSEQWADFWFCMRIKSYAGPAKEAVIRAHYRQREEEKYGRGKPSSEDVWEPRETRLPPGTAFAQPYDDDRAVDESDAEWRAREMERREAIRRQLGFEK